MRLLGFIALGGAVGSVARFLIGAFIQQRVTTPMPVGTLAVNIIGSLLVGFLLTYALASSSISPDVRALLTTCSAAASRRFRRSVTRRSRWFKSAICGARLRTSR